MKINGKDYSLRFSGKTLMIFKEEFGEDLMLLTSKMLSKGIEDTTLLFKLVYAMIKTNGYDVGEFMDWCDGIEDVQSMISESALKEIFTTLSKDRTPTKELKKK